MKLIVLYGPEKSGKTTTLKMVYEVLKRVNQKENHAFRYVDINKYLDFLDILDLEHKQTQDVIDKCLKPISKSVKLIDYNEFNIEDGLLLTLNSINNKTEYETDDIINISLRDNYLTISSLSSAVSEQTTKVGIELEGDYGTHKQKALSLFNLLEELKIKGCEIIICACRTKKSTLKCVLNFVRQYTITAYFIPTLSTKPTSALCTAYAARVLYVLKKIL